MTKLIINQVEDLWGAELEPIVMLSPFPTETSQFPAKMVPVIEDVIKLAEESEEYVPYRNSLINELMKHYAEKQFLSMNPYHVDVYYEEWKMLSEASKQVEEQLVPDQECVKIELTRKTHGEIPFNVLAEVRYNKVEYFKWNR